MNECQNCGNLFSRSDNLKRHQNTCKPTGMKRKYDGGVNSEEDNDRKLKKADNNMIQSTLDDRNSMIQAAKPNSEAEEEEEQRIDRSEVLSGNIEDHIDKFIHEMFPGFDQDSQRYDQLKNDIWGDICEHTEYEGGMIKYMERVFDEGRQHAKLSSMPLKPEKKEEDISDENEEHISEEGLKETKENENESVDEETGPMTNTKKWYQDKKKEDETKYNVFQKVAAKSMKKLVEILTDAT